MQLVPLDQVRARDRARLGGKAVGLGRLLRHGLPVPPGVVVPVSALVDFLQQHGLWERARRGEWQGLGEAIEDAALGEALRRSLAQAVVHLGPLLAVRSSGTEEDAAGASFAGQYESVVGVGPGQPTEQALKRVWASAFSARATAYRGRRRQRVPAMAVVVQAVVEAEVAGVMFTIDPVGGSWREMVLEAAWGLGDAVVGGSVVPDHYKVRRPRVIPRFAERAIPLLPLQVVEETVRVQSRALRVGSAGPEWRAVPAARAGDPKLQPGQIRALCRLGLRAELRLGSPVDVEWAIDTDGLVHLLQARPVTTSASVRRSGPVVWTRRFVGERWSEPATTLGWSEMQALLDPFIAYPGTSQRFLGGGEPSRLVRSAPYFNVTVFRHLAFKLPGAPPPRFMVELLPPEEERRWNRRRAAAPDLAVYADIIRTTLDEQRWRKFRWNPVTNWSAWPAVAQSIDGLIADLRGPIVDPADAIARRVRCRQAADAYVGVHICSLLFANIWYQLAEAALEGAGHADLAPDLLQASAASSTARTNRGLWRLGRGEISEPAFMAEFGHRAASSWELFSPRWSEEPAQVHLLATHAAKGPDPALQGAAMHARQAAAMARLGPRLRWIVDLAQRYLQLREDQRFWFDRLLWQWKQCWLYLENHRGVALRHLDLRVALSVAVGETTAGEVQAQVAERAATLAQEIERRAAGDEPPQFLVGEAAADERGGGRRLQGQGVSQGTYTGEVRVLRSIADGADLRPGQVLVARATDPAWTPLFLTAGALVMELGGMLSHGAVVAREYGVPGVVNVIGATRHLRDGQHVTVDGGRGLVWVH